MHEGKKIERMRKEGTGGTQRNGTDQTERKETKRSGAKSSERFRVEWKKVERKIDVNQHKKNERMRKEGTRKTKRNGTDPMEWKETKRSGANEND
jgi:hypothetical protein